MLSSWYSSSDYLKRMKDLRAGNFLLLTISDVTR